MKFFFILNPKSNSGKSNEKFKIIFDILNKKNINYEYKITSKLEDAYIFSKEANNNGYDVVVAVGGDGTINRVLNGFYDDYGKKISKAKFGVVYTGTSPDFCKSYNISLKLDEAINNLLKLKSKKINIGKIIYLNENINNYNNDKINLNDKNQKVSYFTCCTNIGIGASIARRSNRIRKYFGDVIGTFLSMIISLLTYKELSYTLIIDENKKIINNVLNIFIGKTKYIASGIKVNNDLKINDNRFYILAVKNLKIINFLKVIKKLYSGKKIEKSEEFYFDYGKKIFINRGELNNEIEFDGDPAGFLPCFIENAESMDLIGEE
ncbi:MAG: diacylglycerol kinase family protein [Clostridiales bacterium]